jgi:hypothetical protein
MADIIDLEAVRKAKAEEALLEAAGQFESLVIVGWDHDDDLLVIWGGEISDPDIVFLLEMVKLGILQGDI